MSTNGKKSAVVLVADRDAGTVRALVRLLTTAGYNAVGAQNYDDALRAASCISVDLLICEIDISNRAGVPLVSGIRQLYPVRAFALTGIGSNDEIARSAAAGFDRLFLKPIRFPNLQSEIEEVLHNHATARPSPPA